MMNLTEAPTGRRRQPGRLLHAAAMVLTAGSLSLTPRVAAAAQPTPQRPNLIVVFDDQFRPDLAGAYGGGQNITTPNIDRLAGEGITFENAVLMMN